MPLHAVTVTVSGNPCLVSCVCCSWLLLLPAELYGSDLAEAAQVDMVLEAVADLRTLLKVGGC
jgi:hypothetical protein